MNYPFERLFPLLCAPAALLLATAGAGCGDNSTGGSAGSAATAGSGPGGDAGAAGDAGSGGASGAAGSAGTAGTAGSAGSMAVGNYDCTPPQGSPPALKLTKIADGFSRPIQVKAAPGDNERLFVVEQTGKIWILQNGQTSAEPFLDIQELVADPDAGPDYHQEQGLLGIAFHPNYEKNGRFFVNYSEGPFSAGNNSKGDTHIVEYKRSDDPNKASPTAVKEIMDEAQPFTNHNGGALEFSPKDGFLYIGLGDGGAGGDPMGNGQNITTLLGKMLRIDVDSGNPYANPPGNLVGGRPEIWSIGWRNPWRYSFDACTGDLYVGEVGQDDWEEIDIEPAGKSGKNYGWNTMEGFHCFEPKDGCEMDIFAKPVLEYSHLEGKSVTGGYVYRGSKMPGLRGTYFYADYVSHKVWMFQWKGEAQVTPTEITGDLDPPEALASFGQDNFGEVYLTSLYGGVYRIDPK